MLKSAFEWSVWPLCIAANTAPIVATAVLAPPLVFPAAAVMQLSLLFVLLGIERILPYRTDWSVSGDSEIWRDVGHTLAYGPAVNASRVLFLLFLASLLSARGLTDLFGLWPATSPLWLQITLVIVLGDALEYCYHRL